VQSGSTRRAVAPFIDRMALPETALPSAASLETPLDERATGASGMRLKIATRPAAVGTTWLELFHPGSPSELTLEARVRVIADVAGALIQIHENSGLPRQHRRHGRLTPRHVLITVDGSACLFHVKEPFSRLLPAQPDLGYLAPELLTQSTSANQQCDIFSLGVLLWEALDNGRLFPHRRAAAISRLSSRSLPSPRASEEWALPLCEVALRALAHDPADRYVDATAFWLALREHLPPPDGARAACRVWYSRHSSWSSLPRSRTYPRIWCRRRSRGRAVRQAVPTGCWSSTPLATRCSPNRAAAARVWPHLRPFQSRPTPPGSCRIRHPPRVARTRPGRPRA